MHGELVEEDVAGVAASGFAGRPMIRTPLTHRIAVADEATPQRRSNLMELWG